MDILEEKEIMSFKNNSKNSRLIDCLKNQKKSLFKQYLKTMS